MKNSILKEKFNFLLLLKSAYVKIATMFIVAILVSFQWGLLVSIPCFLVALMYLALTVVITDKEIADDKDYCINKKDKLMLLAYFVVVVFLLVYMLLSGQNFLYSLSTSLALVSVLIPVTKRYGFYIATFLKNKELKTFVDYNFYKSINSSNCISIDDSSVLNFEEQVSGYSTSYVSALIENVDSQDYAYRILGEFALITYGDKRCFNEFKKHSQNYEKAQIVLSENGNVKYIVIKNKDSFRAIASGSFNDILSLCSEGVDRNSLVKADDEFKERNNRNIKKLEDVSDELYSFAYCDIASPGDIENINDMIYVGTIGVKKVISKETYKLFDYIQRNSKSFEIEYTNENKDDIIEILKICNIENYKIENQKVILGEKCNKKIVIGENMVSAESGKKEIDFDRIPAYKVLEYCERAGRNSFAYLNLTRVFSISLIIAYLLSGALIPNSFMHPFVIVIVGGLINILSAFSVGEKYGNIHSPVMFIVNICTTVFCALGIFFAGRFFVNVPMEQFDAGAVNMARMMVMSFYILTVGMYDSIFVLSNIKKYRLNAVVMAFSILFVLLINIPVIATNIGLLPMSAEAFKFVIFFSLIPVLVNGVEGSISNKRG